MSSRLSSPRAVRRRGSVPRAPASRTFIGAGLAVLAATALGSASMLGHGMLTAAATAAQQAADMIAERSPGLRTRAEMTKGKPRLFAERTAEALPRTRTPAKAAVPAAAAVPAPAGIGGPAEVLPPALLAPTTVVPAAPGGGIVIGDAGPGFGLLPPGPGLVIGGGGGGLVIAPPGASPETPPAAPPAPIPEPSSWAMLILGFGALGGALRRRTRPALVNG
jgi:hypothetical protein